MFRDTLHKIKIFFCDDDIEKIYVRDSTVIRNNEIHKMYDEYIGYNDILVIIGFGILLSFMLTIIPILLSYDIRDEIIELIGDMDSQIVVDTSVYKTNLS